MRDDSPNSSSGHGTGRRDLLIGAGLALAAFALYTRTLAPGLGGTVDSAELQQAAARLALVHTTGYPLYLLLARLAITVIPIGEPAFRVTLLSAVFGAAAAGVLYLLVRQVTAHRGAALAAAALFSVQPVPWATAGVAEINTLNTLLTGGAFLAAAAWGAGQLPFWAVAGAYGLAAGHHRTALLYAPLLLLWVLWVAWRAPARRPTRRSLVGAAVLGVLPFAAYLYLPLRAATTPWYENTWRGFLAEVLGDSAWPVIQATLARPLGPRLKLIFLEQAFRDPAGGALLILGLGGLVMLLQALARRQPGAAPPGPDPWGTAHFQISVLALCAGGAGIGFAFAVVYDIYDVSDYLAVPLFLWSVLVGAGLAAGLRLFSATPLWRHPTPLVRGAWRLAPTPALIALVVFTGTRSLARQDIRVDYSTLDRRPMWRAVQAQPLPPGAILIGDSVQVNEVLYVQHVEGWRPDLRIFFLGDVLAGEALAQWLAEERPVYLLGQFNALLQRYSAEPAGPLWRVTGRVAPPATAAVTHPLGWRQGDSILLRGYTLDPDPPVVAPGGQLRLTLYWQATARIFARYTVFNHIVDTQGNMAGQQDDEPGHGFQPTILWQPGEIVTDTFAIAIHADAAPGPYRLMSGFYDSVSLQRLPTVAATGEALGDYPQLTVITIK